MSTPQTVLIAHPGAELFGSDRMVLESAIGLLDTGARVVAALPSQGPLAEELRTAGAEVVLVPMLVLRKALIKPTGWGRLFRDSLRGLGSAWRLIGKVRPDVVYVSTITIPQWPLIAWMRRASSISHVHEAEASGSRLVNRMLYLPHRLSRDTLVNSRFSMETIRACSPALARRSTVVYNGVASPERPAPPRNTIDGPLRLLYVGRLSPRKGVDLVIEAASLLQKRGQDTTVTLLGTVFEGYEWYEKELREQARTSGVTVTFAGFRPAIWPFLAEADALIVPSRIDEPFGNTAVEGVLALRPVITSDAGGLPEAADGYSTTRVVRAGDASAIADELESLTSEWSKITADVSSCRSQALARHSPDAYRAAVIAALDPDARYRTDGTPPADRRA